MDARMVFNEVMNRGVEMLCWRHVRVFAGDSVGLLKNGIRNNELRHRLQRLYICWDNWGPFSRENRDWFRKSFRIPTKENDLISFQFRVSTTSGARVSI